jgi:hypothetical protein
MVKTVAYAMIACLQRSSWIAAIVLLAANSTDALTADIRPHSSFSSSYRPIVVEGKIQRGDFDTFVRILREDHGQVGRVYCFSRGDDLEIGRAMRALSLHSQAPMRSPSGRPVCPYGAGSFSRCGAVQGAECNPNPARPHRYAWKERRASAKARLSSLVFSSAIWTSSGASPLRRSG